MRILNLLYVLVTIKLGSCGYDKRFHPETEEISDIIPIGGINDEDQIEDTDNESTDYSEEEMSSAGESDDLVVLDFGITIDLQNPNLGQVIVENRGNINGFCKFYSFGNNFVSKVTYGNEVIWSSDEVQCRHVELYTRENRLLVSIWVNDYSPLDCGYFEKTAYGEWRSIHFTEFDTTLRDMMNETPKSINQPVAGDNGKVM
ncbi:hypothetical protein BEWA_027560 [Theileria equi strain WA]|uniref:Signal peptide-containing protein n=1 Tax=Theileria equi strain WA TaxID=1537102 RepID=L0AWF5_THEEQ|nr:hypothetical protein BEWA_027560 [Theileria equi strain WA]AFZ79907.1 hypothetical protein BEWA_027560 [Theileria equi strain WA]|eukprot:XP_004829573.1 hypothetical protein BEWA_027560 [Theileria equi strain WA]